MQHPFMVDAEGEAGVMEAAPAGASVEPAVAIPAVAAASVLARAEFLIGLKDAGNEFGLVERLSLVHDEAHSHNHST